MNTKAKIDKTSPKKVNLALQGGGAHGAFAWGVIDKICEDGRLSIDGLTASSAGAMNTAVYAYGKMKHGLDGARAALHDFWQDISAAGVFIETQRPLFVAEELILTFSIAGFDKPLKIKGEIVQVNRNGIGVEFKDMSPYVEEMLATLIDRMKEEQDK